MTRYTDFKVMLVGPSSFLKVVFFSRFRGDREIVRELMWKERILFVFVA